MKRLMFIILAGLFLCGCSSRNAYRSSTNEECIEIKKQESSFKIPEIFCSDAELIKDIDDSLSLKKSYVLDTDREYCCMNMESHLIYMFIEDEDGEEMEEKFLDLFYGKGIRLDMGESNVLTGEDANGNRKLIFSNVYCEAVLSQEIYEDFTGMAAVVKDNGRLLGVFVGAKGRKIELDDDRLEIMTDVTHTLTSERGKNEPQNVVEGISSVLSEGIGGMVCIKDERGVLRQIELKDIRVLNREEAILQSPTEESLKELKEPPEGAVWHYVMVNSDDDVEFLNIKIKDKNGSVFEYGSRTYTVSMTSTTRIDAYLLPEGEDTYFIEIGERDNISTMSVIYRELPDGFDNPMRS